MAMSADHRVMPLETPTTEGEPPASGMAPNLFAPISTANRITGNSRVHRQQTLAQLAPGSAYDYGRIPYGAPETYRSSSEPDFPTVTDRVPPTFLHRTMIMPAQTNEEAPLGFAAQGAPAPEPWPERAEGYADTRAYPMVRANASAEAYPAALAYPSAGGYPATQAYPTAEVYPGAGGYPASQTYPVTQAYPIAQAYPTAEAYPSAGEYPAAQTYPVTQAYPAVGAYFPAQPSSAVKTYPVPGAYRPAEPKPAAGENPAVFAYQATADHPAMAQRHTAEGSPAAHEPVGAYPTGSGLPQTPAFSLPTAQAAYGDAPAEKGSQPAYGAQPDTAAPRSRRVARAGTAAPYAPDVPDTADYLPKHGGTPMEMGYGTPAYEPPVDVWEAMGWKSPEPSGFENTAVMRLSDLTMFERDAFGDPLDPLRNPPKWGMETLQTGGDPQAIPNPMMGEGMPLAGYPGPYSPAAMGEGEAYAPYDAQQPGAGYPPYAAYEAYEAQGFMPDQEYAPHGQQPYAQDGAAAARRPNTDTERANRRAAGAKRKGQGFTLASLGPWRIALIVAASLALLFSLVEGYRMVSSLWGNEQTAQDYLEEYRNLTGGDTAQEGDGVVLLPPGVTYVPTATPVAVQTPTPEPRIDQNDPLIGVLDSAGNAVTPQQPALPTSTPATRTRLTQYPGNALLGISDAFADLRAENPDVVGRLVIEGVIDEVLVQRNNTFYLNHNARGLLGESGAVFVDESCSLKAPPENLLVRGQANEQGKLFEPLMQYETQGKAFVETHGIVRCDTLYEQAQYVVFAVIRADSVVGSADYFSYAGYPTFQSDTQMMNYVEAAKLKSLHKISVSVRPDDRLLTVATLAEGSDTTCLVLLCRMLRDGETANHIQQN